MRPATFEQSVEELDTSPMSAGGDSIKNEPMLYGASWAWANDNAGPITKAVMHEIQAQVFGECVEHALRGYHPVIDTKSVLLMPGQYPCIPGWHCDGVVRPSRGEQPDLSTLWEPIHHYTCVISENGGSGTQFAKGRHAIEVAEDSVWKSVDEQLKDCNWIPAESGRVYRFRRNQLHRGNRASKRGWRYFFRLSFYHMPAANEIRKQVQIYADTGMGW